MIRKILFLSIVLIAIVWLAGAHYIKNKVLDSLDSLGSDNIEVSYSDTSIGGFPFLWSFTLLEPKITLINQSSIGELSTEEVRFYFNYDLSSVRVQLPKKIGYKENQAEISYDYSLISDNRITADISFVEPLLFIKKDIIDVEYIRSFDLSIPFVKNILDNRDIFHIKTSKLQFNRKDVGDDIAEYDVKLTGEYKSLASYLKLDKANLLFDASYIVSNDSFIEKSDRDFDHKIKVRKGLFQFDNAFVDISGVVKLTRASLPQGKIKVSMAQYQDVVDLLVPEDFMISKSYIKKVIAKATMPSLNKVASNEDVIGFEIDFSNNGVSIGDLNLLELNID